VLGVDHQTIGNDLKKAGGENSPLLAKKSNKNNEQKESDGENSPLDIITGLAADP
jgi:hypothetical protein